MKLKDFNKKVWPYQYKNWLWKVGLRLRDIGVFNQSLGPVECFELLDPESWMLHFMSGVRPWDAVDLDIKEGGE